MPLVGVALGSNLGDRRSHLEAAIASLGAILADLRVSSVFETEPVDLVGPQGPFLNAAVAGEFPGTPRELLVALQMLEGQHGRRRPHAGAARTLDLDLIFFGEERVEESGLVVPHPRFRDRRFVLEPLAEVAPDWRDPVTRLTVTELLSRLPVAPAPEP